MSHVVVGVANSSALGTGARVLSIRGVCGAAAAVETRDLCIAVSTGERGQRVVERIEHRKPELHLVTILNPESLG